MAAGETFTVSMVVLGRALHTVPLIALAWARACADGLGRNRVPADLVGYRDESEAHWRDPMAATGHATAGVPIPQMPQGAIEIRFVTPFRARKEGTGTGQTWDWNYGHALKEAETIRWEPLDARWADWTRYSSRQKQSMQLGGILGAYRIPAEALSPFWPLIYLGQWTHVGKNASFGLGQYTLSEA